MPYCANQYIHAWEDGCEDGALEKVDYLGANARGEDIYELQYMHADVTVGIAPRTSYGRMGKFWIKRGNPNAITPSSLADVSASVARKMTLYRRTPVAAAQAATPPAAAAAPRTRTEPALGCLLGFGSWRCPDGAVTPARWCGEMYEDRWLGDCREGRLETVDYLGTNGAGADVYDVRFRRATMTYVIAPPSPSEKKGGIWIGKNNPEAINPSSLVDVSASTAGKMNLYRSTD